jgi:hypothetical protein
MSKNEELDNCVACGALGCDCIYECDDCGGWHISDWAIKELGITQEELAKAKQEAEQETEKGE